MKTLEYSDADGDSITLYVAPCQMQIPGAGNAFAAQGTFGGKVFSGCWAMSPPRVLIQWSDGDGGNLHMGVFKPGVDRPAPKAAEFQAARQPAR